MKPVNSLQRSLLQAVRLLNVAALILSLGVAGSVHAAGPDLTVQVLNSGDFIEGGTGSTYTVTVSNVGDTPTSGLVTMEFTLNATYFTATAISGGGWTCDLGTLTCTRSDALGGGGFSYPAITITVDVANDTPETVDNDASISGGGDVNGDNNVDFDTTNIEQVADLTIEKTHSPVEFVQGEQGAYTITVTNDGDGPTTGLVTVTEILPEGLTAVSFDGTGWSCSLVTLVCTRSDALAAGASYPDITLTVSVNLSANDPEINEVFVDGGGELNTANNNSVDVTDIKLQPDLRIDGYQLIDPLTGNPLVGNTALGESFLVKLFVENQGGSSTPGVFYRSVYVDGLGDFLPGDPRDETDYELFSQLGITTDSSYEYAGCLYYDDPDLFISQGTFYTDQNFLGIPAGTTDSQNSIVEVSGLGTGTYNLYFYADPTCLVEEVNENNNSYGPITVHVGANINVAIGGVSKGNYQVASGEERREYYNTSGGPVKVESAVGIDIVSAIRLQSYANDTLYSFVETMGVPDGLLSHKYYFPTYNNTWSPLNSQVRFGNLNATATTIRVTIGGVNVWEESVPALEERRLYFNVSGGPVIIESLDPAKKIVAAIRLQSYANDTLYSFSETMGIPDEFLSDTYYFPTYNNTWTPLNSQIRVGNLNASDTTVRITIGGVNVWEDVVPGFGEQRLYFDVSGGPVVVESLDPAKKIVAAIRLQSYVNDTLYSFVETMGVPDGLLSHKYYFPTYNNTWAPLNSQVRFANLNASATTIRVTIGGVNVWEQSVPGLEERRLNFNVSGGPVIIESLDPAKKIVAAIRLQSYANDTLYSFAETMGIPAEQMSDVFYFPTYNNTWTPLNSQLRFGVP